jgi:cytochrome P450
MAVSFDPLSADDWQNPYPVYRQLRDEAPVYFAPKTGVWCVSRHADVVEVLKNHDDFQSSRAFELLIEGRFKKFGVRDALELVRFLVRGRINPLEFRRRPPENLITSDPPRHDVLRSIVNRGFTPRRIEAWAPRARELSQECVAKLRRGEPFDVVHDLAIPLPVTIIAEMLGVERERHSDFKRWSDEIIAGSSGSGRDLPVRVLLRTLGELQGTLKRIAKQRRRVPADDLISLLVDPSYEEALDDRDIVGFVLLLLIAGNETTTNLIGNATNALLDHPEQLERVQADPSLIPGLVEEVIRYDGPVQFILRQASRDVTLAGQKISEGSRVAVLLGSANRDERFFDDPDRFDVTRNTNGHVGFGFGVHFCLGASLARLEGAAALEALIPELPRVRRREREVHLVDSFLVRGPQRLELERAA